MISMWVCGGCIKKELYEENIKLRTENALLKSDSEKLKEENALLKGDSEKLKLYNENAHLKEENKRLLFNVDILVDRLRNEPSNIAKIEKIQETAINKLLSYSNNINNIDIEGFYNQLSAYISDEECLSSYKDFKYYILLSTNELYLELLNNCDRLISKFNEKYSGKYNIIKITNIVCREMYIQTHERGCGGSGFYSAEFTVYYKKIETI